MPTENQWLVFVYGTLKRGYGNWYRLLKDREGVEFIGEAISADPAYLMLDGGFPQMTEAPDQCGHFVRGELFRVTDSVRVDLDRLEGHPKFYERKLRGFHLMTATPGEPVQAWVYLNPYNKIYSTRCKQPTGDGEPKALVWNDGYKLREWTCSMAMLRHFPQFWRATDPEHLIRQVRYKYQKYTLEIEDFTDEVHVFYRDGKGKRRRFCNLQLED